MNQSTNNNDKISYKLRSLTRAQLSDAGKKDENDQLVPKEEDKQIEPPPYNEDYENDNDDDNDADPDYEESNEVDVAEEDNKVEAAEEDDAPQMSMSEALAACDAQTAVLMAAENARSHFRGRGRGGRGASRGGRGGAVSRAAPAEEKKYQSPLSARSNHSVVSHASARSAASSAASVSSSAFRSAFGDAPAPAPAAPRAGGFEFNFDNLAGPAAAARGLFSFAAPPARAAPVVPAAIDIDRLFEQQRQELDDPVRNVRNDIDQLKQCITNIHTHLNALLTAANNADAFRPHNRAQLVQAFKSSETLGSWITVKNTVRDLSFNRLSATMTGHQKDFATFAATVARHVVNLDTSLNNYLQDVELFCAVNHMRTAR